MRAALAGRAEAPHKQDFVRHLPVTMKRRSSLLGTAATLNAVPDRRARRAAVRPR
jgi:hypothetical protein